MAQSCNNGLSFGIFSSATALLPLLLLGLLAVCVITYYYLFREHAVGFGLVIGGGCSNVLDRFVLGCVQDWLPIPFTGLLNNVADWAIFAGVGVVALQILLLGKEKSKS